MDFRKGFSSHISANRGQTFLFVENFHSLEVPTQCLNAEWWKIVEEQVSEKGSRRRSRKVGEREGEKEVRL